MAKRGFMKRQPLIIEAKELRFDDTEVINDIKIDGSFDVGTIKRLIFENYGVAISNNQAKKLRAGGQVVLRNTNPPVSLKKEIENA